MKTKNINQRTESAVATPAGEEQAMTLREQQAVVYSWEHLAGISQLEQHGGDVIKFWSKKNRCRKFLQARIRGFPM